MKDKKPESSRLLTETISLIDICAYYGVPYTSQGLECIPKLCAAQRNLTLSECQEALRKYIYHYYRGENRILEVFEEAVEATNLKGDEG